MMKRITLILISFLLVISFCSCGNENQTQGDDAQSEQDNKNGDTIETEEEVPEYPAPDIPAKDYAGIEFNVVCHDDTANNGNNPYSELGVTKENGEALNDAIYARNLALEEKYNIKIVCTELPNSGDTRTLIQNTVLAGEDAYDVVSISPNHASILAANGQLTPLSNYEYVDFDAPWWLPHVVENTSIGGVVYMTPGYSNIAFFDLIGTIYFNKQMVEDFKIDSPYEMVENNKWTFDNFIALCRGVTTDLDGDGVFTEKDMYGFMANNSCWTNFFYSNGNQILSKDENDIPVMDFLTEKSIGVIEKMIKFMHDTDTSYLVEKVTGYPEAAGQQRRRDMPYEALIDNRALFVSDTTYSIRYFRNMKADFGVLPPPKYDESQERYISYVHAQSSMTIVPITNSKPELTDMFLEDLMYYSYQLVRPAYFENSFNVKYTRDDESVRMLEYIFNGARVDLGLYLGLTFDNDVRVLMFQNSTDIQSVYTKNESANLKKLADMVDAFTTVE